MSRVDSAPIKYHLDPETGKYLPGVDPKHGTQKQWNLKKLNSRENPLVMFTLASQAGVGALVLALLGPLFGWDIKPALVSSNSYTWLPFLAAVFGAIGLFLSSTHLGKPMRFYRGFNNFRYSTVSRGSLSVSLFFGFVGAHWLFGLMCPKLPVFNALSLGFACSPSLFIKLFVNPAANIPDLLKIDFMLHRVGFPLQRIAQCS